MTRAGPPTRRHRPILLAGECALLFLGVPAAAAGWVPLNVIVLLWLMALICGWAWQHRTGLTPASVWRPAQPAREWGRMFAWYGFAMPALALGLWLCQPADLFELLLRHPRLWLLVMVAYPALSVLPQEFLYRVFFFARYRDLFGEGRGMVAASAAVFGFAHVVFHNPLAVAFTLAGGWIFGRTYQRTGSLFLVAVEHALYGCAIFTIGYGKFFFDGTLGLLQASSGG